MLTNIKEMFLKLLNIKQKPTRDEIFANSRIFEKPVVLYFSPHQDDEVLTLGIDACNEIKQGKQPHVVLCVDGSMSAVRERLGNGESCNKHEGVHNYKLNIAQFIAARDREFQFSCAALGYNPSDVHFFPMRAIDQELSLEMAEMLIKSVISQYPQGVAVRTISPFGGEKQHKDHKMLGQAALNLFNQGIIKDLKLFIEPYCVAACRSEHPEIKLTSVTPNEQTHEYLRNALAQYSKWDPADQRYALGFHSVAGQFDRFLDKPVAYYHIPIKE